MQPTSRAVIAHWSRATLITVAFGLILSACAGEVVSTIFEDVGDPSSEPTDAPAPDVPADEQLSGLDRYTDVEQTALLAESIDIVYCGSEAKPDWCPWFDRVAVDERWAEVHTDLSEAEMAVAESMCSDIASVTSDHDAEPIGVTHVLILGAGGAELTDCEALETRPDPAGFDVELVKSHYIEECVDPIVLDDLFCTQVKIERMTADGMTLIVPTTINATGMEARAAVICDQIAILLPFDGATAETPGFEDISVLDRYGDEDAHCGIRD